MDAGSNAKTGGQLIVESLLAHGADTVFCVPGESYLATLDAFCDAEGRLKIVVCRQEGGAAYMAEAYGKLTGKPGICFVTRGPGASNATVGLHTAYQDATPMVVFIGQVPRGSSERVAFQEIDFRRMLGQVAKWVGQIEDPARVPEYVSHAFHLATSGRPGPVVLAIPEDMQVERAAVEVGRHYSPVRAGPRPEDMAALADLLAKAERPTLLVGGSGWTPDASAGLAAFADAHGIPVVAGFRRQDLIDNRNGHYIGPAGLGMGAQVSEAIGDADLLIALGQQLTDIVTNEYALLSAPEPRQTLVQIHPGTDEIGRVFRPALGIPVAPPEFCAAAGSLSPTRTAERTARIQRLRATYEKSTAPPPPPAHGVDLASVVSWLSGRLPDDAIVANGAGNFSQWVHRYYVYRSYPSQLAPINGSMGYGAPAAIMAKIAHPDRTVVGFCGDGDFLMNGQELSTAVAQGANVVLVLANNGRYGTIRAHQERHYPGRVSATELANPNFAEFARSFGAHGERIERTEDFADAFERALAAGKPALLELMTDPDQLSPTATVESLRASHGS